MYALRRQFDDGPEAPEIVLIHATAAAEESRSPQIRACTVVPPSATPGIREVRLFLPSPPAGDSLTVSYFFSAVRSGAEWRSPRYRIILPGEADPGDLVVLPEAGAGNLAPAPGRGTFRLVLPLRAGEPPEGTVRFGFGAMRRKPSPDLCRLALPYGPGNPPVVEAPETLAVLKGRPMPFFLYHIGGAGGALAADKITSARVTFRDGDGDVLCVRLLWSGRGWAAPNVASMEPKGIPPGPGSAAGDLFEEDRAGFLAAREAAISRLPRPRTFEGYLFGPAGSVAEYCFLVARRRPDGAVAVEWRNRDGGNWEVAL